MTEPHPSVSWAVEPWSITLFHREKRERRALRYPEAALWDFISRRYALDRAVRLLGAIAGLDEPAARALASATIEDWVRSGYLVEVTDHGQSRGHDDL